MNKMLYEVVLPIIFALGTAFFWGCYGPTIGNAQAPRVDGAPLWSPFKPYLFIGMAYLVIGIIGAAVLMKLKGDTFVFTGQHFATVKWGFLAGSLGAFGALCLTSAMMFSKGNALLVMPIVFGGAVSVAALVTVLINKYTVSPLLWVGMLITVIGVAMVAMNTPHGHAASPSPAAGDGHSESTDGH